MAARMALPWENCLLETICCIGATLCNCPSAFQRSLESVVFPQRSALSALLIFSAQIMQTVALSALLIFSAQIFRHRRTGVSRPATAGYHKLLPPAPKPGYLSRESIAAEMLGGNLAIVAALSDESAHGEVYGFCHLDRFRVGEPISGHNDHFLVAVKCDVPHLFRTPALRE